MPVRFAQYLALAAASTGLVLTGCDQPAPVNDLAVVEDSSAVAAYVDGEPIYVSDVILAAEAEGAIEEGDELEPDSAEFNRVLDGLIDVRLMAMEAEARGLNEDPQARFRLQSIRDNTLSNILIETVVAERVDEAAVRKMYEAQISISELGEEAHVRQIVVPTKADMDAIMAELDSGTDFAVLASQRSIDESTRLEGGDLGYLSEDSVPPAFAQAIKSTATGGVSRPFETSNGWRVLKIEERREEAPPSLEELRGPILNYLGMIEIDKLLKQLRSESQIDRKSSASAAPLRTDPFSIAPEEEDEEMPRRIEAQADTVPAANEEAVDAPAEESDGETP